ncbi:unnamed protein product [Symbiodinium natans]|uniref:Class I SAM-dependent methyltransferase n=1 Tax=Symbiodinium natans TaxID=878477 RepID=A0A812JHA8_9DINO|nr:unnamed protein product [Symbiodinium natans]
MRSRSVRASTVPMVSMVPLVHLCNSLLWCVRAHAANEGGLADPQGVLPLELAAMRQSVFQHLSKAFKQERTSQSLAMDRIWAAVHELVNKLTDAALNEGLSLAAIRNLASLRALNDIGLLEQTVAIPLPQPGANRANQTSSVCTDLRWVNRLLPRGDRAAVALGHMLLSWVMLNSLRADRDGLVRMESTSSITQAWWLSQQASSATVRQICEVGFNGGHSAWAMLASAPPEAQMVSFDLISKSYTRSCHRVIRSVFSRRHRLLEGSSNVSVPHFISQNLAHKCDLIFIDGSHTEADAAADLLHMSLLATAGSLLVMDDIGCTSSFCHGPTAAWHSFISAGRVSQLGCQEESERRWCWGLYI